MGVWKLITSVNEPALLTPAVTTTDSLPLPTRLPGVLQTTPLQLAHTDASHSVHPIDADTLAEVRPKP
jgi:hypothetical protein